MQKYNILLFANKSFSDILIRRIRGIESCGKIFVYEQERHYHQDDSIVNHIEIKTLADCKKIIEKNGIDLVVVTLNDLCNKGIVNYCKYNLKIPTIGVTRYWMQLEESKLYGKRFMQDNEIPYSEYRVIYSLKELKLLTKEYGYPIVLKDNNQRAGFGSYICRTEKESIEIGKKLLKENSFFIAERYIAGEEVTLHTIWDGEELVSLIPVRDYKRLKNNNEGINTGSMGSYTPVELSEKKRELIAGYVKQLEKVFKKVRPNFTGVFASDLIFTEEEIYNLEFNMRPCTPEFEVLLEHMEIDILNLLYEVANGRLSEVEIKYKEGKTGCVNVFHKDYINRGRADKVIKEVKIPSKFLSDQGSLIINNYILEIDKKSRAKIHPYMKVLSIVNNDKKEPFEKIYSCLESLTDKNLYYRTDIGE